MRNLIVLASGIFLFLHVAGYAEADICSKDEWGRLSCNLGECFFTDRGIEICDYEGVSAEDAVAELARIFRADGTFEATSAARHLIEGYAEHDVLLQDRPELLRDVYIHMIPQSHEDWPFQSALRLIQSGQADAPPAPSMYLQTLSQYMNRLRVAEHADLAVEIASSHFGAGPQTQDGQSLPGYRVLMWHAANNHDGAADLLAAWSGATPLEDERTILRALEGDPEALTIIGEALLSGEGHDAFNHKRIVTRTGHIEGYPFDVAKGIAFLEAASAKGHAPADAVLAEHAFEVAAVRQAARVEEQRLQAEEREKAEAAAQLEQDRETSEQAEQDRQNLVGAPGPYTQKSTRLDNLVDAAADTLVQELCRRLKKLPSSGGFLMTGGRISFANNYCTMTAPTGSSNSYYVSRVDILDCTGRRCTVRVTLSCGFRGLLAAAECADFNRGYFRNGTALIAEDGIGVEAFRIEL